MLYHDMIISVSCWFATKKETIVKKMRISMKINDYINTIELWNETKLIFKNNISKLSRVHIGVT